MGLAAREREGAALPVTRSRLIDGLVVVATLAFAVALALVPLV